ncbi:MAG: NADH:ubiquinone reductase (Na(+)-transporting) subunit A, partial [Planctomycetota bacterium]
MAGPAASNPRLVRTTVGVSMGDLIGSELDAKPDQVVRVISGSVFGGRTASGVVN